jgi:5-methylcytosine-specific restriction protein A
MSSTHVQPWTAAELEAAVIAYLGMLKHELLNTPYNKSATNQSLRDGPVPDRSKSSIEMRMQNISAVLHEMKLPSIKGYAPIGNVGSNVKPLIVSAIIRHSADMPFAPTTDAALYQERVEILRGQPFLEEPVGIASPKKSTSTITAFERDPKVKAWVLQNAGIHCEGCRNVAPFESKPGVPYFEVHHVIPLAENGPDTVTNTVALCPNCHRRCHHSRARHEFVRELYEDIPRLLPRPEEIEPVFI